MNLKDFGCGLVWTDQPYFSIWSNTGKKDGQFSKKANKRLKTYKVQKNLENIKKISKKLSESLFFNIKSDTPRDKYLKK